MTKDEYRIYLDNLKLRQVAEQLVILLKHLEDADEIYMNDVEDINAHIEVILDVLNNYTRYQSYYQIQKSIDDNHIDKEAVTAAFLSKVS